MGRGEGGKCRLERQAIPTGRQVAAYLTKTGVFSILAAPFMESQEKKNSDRVYYFFALRIIGDFGASIAVPVVLFVLAGQWLDAKYHKSPWFTIAGFTLAAVSSAKIIYAKAKKYGAEYQQMNQK